MKSLERVRRRSPSRDEGRCSSGDRDRSRDERGKESEREGRERRKHREMERYEEDEREREKQKRRELERDGKEKRLMEREKRRLRELERHEEDKGEREKRKRRELLCQEEDKNRKKIQEDKEMLKHSSHNVPIEKREETIPKEVKQKVRRTHWDEPPENISLPAGKPTVCEEAATEYVILTDMFDPEIEEQHGFYLDIRDEFQEDCCKIGAVVQGIHFDRESGGFCFRFDNKRSAALAKNRFNGRAGFHGKPIKAKYLEEGRYRKRYGR